MSTNWYEEWFNTPLYEKLYANRNEEEAAKLADLIQKEIPAEKYPELLDLGCGRGRHSIALAKRGYSVTGIDLSEEAIKKARKQAKKRGIKEIRFLVRDMRNPLGQTFDAVLNLFTTFGYFLDDSENALVFRSVNRMLKTSGLFMIDYLNPDYVKNTLVPLEEDTFSDKHVEIQRKIENGMVHKIMKFSGKGMDEPVRFRERVKLYGPDWFEKNLNNAGFDIVKKYGSYEGESFDPVSSSRQILITEKKGT